MKCPNCDGKGRKYLQVFNVTMECPYCNGSGEVEMTNEEWLKSLDTEELAEFLWKYTHDLITDWRHISDPMFRHMPLKNVLGDNCTKKGAWVEWLKQQHKE